MKVTALSENGMGCVNRRLGVHPIIHVSKIRVKGLTARCLCK
jgi:hypothetical protein